MTHKKVLILSHTRHDSVFKIGSHHYANTLSKLGYDVSFMSTPQSIIHKLIRNDLQKPSQLSSNVKNISFIMALPITVCLFKIISNLNKLFSYNRWRNFDKFDVIICDQPFFFPYISFFEYDRLIYRPTDIYADLIGVKVKNLERGMIELADKVIATSQAVASNISNVYLCPFENIDILSNGYDSCHFSMVSNSVRRGYVYVGSLDKRFDFELLDKLAEIKKNERIDIYGPILSDAKIEVDRLENKHTNVRFLGEISYLELPTILNSYQYGLLPCVKSKSNLGRSPMKLFEYLACGLRVIYSNIDSHEVVKYGLTFDKHLSGEVILNENIDIVLNEITWENKAKMLATHF